jgi:hypothetical protein
MRRLVVRHRPTPAMVVALIALFVALGGTGYGASMIVRGSGPSVAASAKASKKKACVSVNSLCPKLRSAVDKRITAYAKAHRSQLRGATGATGAAGATGGQGAQGIQGQPGPAGVGVDALFGDGSDGTATITADTTLVRDEYYAELSIAPGVTLDTGGFKILVSGTLTLGDGSQISRNANGSFPLTGGTLGGSASGGTPATHSGATAVNSLGGVGGAGGPGNPGGAAVRPAVNVGGANAFDSALQALSGRTLDGVVVEGGSGGGGATTAGFGGAGGGVVVVAARLVAVNGDATISAVGGAPGGDAGGGGGGVVAVVTTSPQPPGLTLSAAAGGTAPHAGTAGFTDWLS